MKLLSDLQFSLRLLGKTPAFAMTSLVIIVLGIVLYLCSYTLVYNFSDKPLPFADGDRFVAVKTIYKNSGTPHSGSNFDDYAVNYLSERVKSFEEFHAYRYKPLTISNGEFPQQFDGGEIEPDILSMTQTAPFLGRLLADEDTFIGAQPVAVISFDVWQNYYAKDPDIIGKTSLINGDSYIVVGVMPENFDYPNFQDVWLPLTLDRSAAPTGILTLTTIGKLKTNVSLTEASNEIDRLMAELVADYPAYYGDSPDGMVSPHTAINQGNSELGTLLSILQYAILSLLVVNLSILLFYRAHTRQRELAVRCALGASPLHISRQVLLESAVLCLAGLVISLIVASFALYAIEQAFINSVGGLLSWVSFAIDWHSLSVALLATIGLWFLSGIWVAVQTTRIDTNTVLASGTKGTGGQRTHWVTRAVVGAEVIASTFLLIMCSLVSIAIFKLYDVDFGVATENRLTASIQLRGSNYQTPQQRLQLIEALQADFSNEVEFQSSTIAFGLPGQYGELFPYQVEDRDLSRDQQYPFVTNIAVADNYFDALRIPLLEGRSFSASDTADSLPVIVIDELLANQLWASESALGKRIGITREGETQWLTVVGVNRHIIHGPPTNGPETRPVIYRPISQFTPYFYSFVLELAPSVSQAAATRTLQNIVKQEDSNLAVLNIQSLQSLLDRTHAGYDIIANLSTAFGLATFVFSLIGVYGLIARSVSERQQEVGIRKSLGSSTAKVLWLFLRQGGYYLLVGSLIGGTAAIFSSGLLTSLFDNLLDALPIVAISVVLMMGVMILLASYLPARKAAAMEPGDALREE